MVAESKPKTISESSDRRPKEPVANRRKTDRIDPEIIKLLNQASEAKIRLLAAESERERWQAIFTTVDESIVIIDQNGLISQANPATEILLGLDLPDIQGYYFEEIFPLHNERGLSLSGDVSPVKTVLTTNEPIEFLEAKLLNSEGREVWVGLSLTPIKKPLSTISGHQIVIVIRDISRLKEIDRAKSDFVSMASHELRTPLTVINGYISLFLNGDLGDIDKPELAHYRQVFEQIYKSTQRLNHLVEDLLNVSRIEQGRLNYSFDQVNLQLLLKEVVEEMQINAQAHSHKLDFTSPKYIFIEAPVIVNADYEKLKQVLINLIDNAIKYTPDGGAVSVSFRKDRREVIVSISDTGRGIPKELIPRIFEKFQRLEGRLVKDVVGTGLGLFIVKELIKAHGGRIWVDSQVDKGTTFHFALPL